MKLSFERLTAEIDFIYILKSLEIYGAHVHAYVQIPSLVELGTIENSFRSSYCGQQNTNPVLVNTIIVITFTF